MTIGHNFNRLKEFVEENIRAKEREMEEAAKTTKEFQAKRRLHEFWKGYRLARKDAKKVVSRHEKTLGKRYGLIDEDDPSGFYRMFSKDCKEFKSNPEQLDRLIMGSIVGRSMLLMKEFGKDPEYFNVGCMLNNMKKTYGLLCDLGYQDNKTLNGYLNGAAKERPDFVKHIKGV